MTEREIALNLLLAAERQEKASFDSLLKEALFTHDDLPGPKKSFLVHLCQGTFQYRIRLDYVLDLFAQTPVNKMKPLIRNLLRMSVYQILFLREVPDAAACDEAVKLAAKRGFSSLKGFVNGVLRKISREKESISYPDREDSRYLSVLYSMPRVLCDHFTAAYGASRADRICEALLNPRPVSIRLRRERLREDGVTEEVLFERMAVTAKGLVITPHPVVPEVFLLTHPGNLTRLYGYAEGYIAVQDAASVLAVQLAGIRAGDRVIDVCASPGGKSAHAADCCGREGSVIARDVSERKLQPMEENFTRYRLSQMQTQVHDARITDRDLYGKADVLLCDLPCSALGIIGRKPEVKYRFRTEDARSLVKLQQEILQAVWPYVKRGGTLLYSTCTLNPEENEEQVRWICDNLPFDAVDLAPRVPPSLREEAGLQEGMLQLFPGSYDSDGFFMAVLRRREEG